MTLNSTSYVKRAEVVNSDEDVAVKEFAAGVEQPDMAGVVFFCSADYDLEKLGTAMKARFNCPVIGCTSAGEIASTYQNGGIVGASFSGAAFQMHTAVINDLDRFTIEAADELVHDLKSELEFTKELNSEKMFGFLLIDGLSLMEERTIAPLYKALGLVSIIGGSAGDSLNFKDTKIYADGSFHSDAAVFALMETTLPFYTFKLQHFLPTEMDLIITESDPAKRIVYEINGEPAANEYAEILGIDRERLNPQIFSMYPLMLQIGNDWYVRSIEKMNEDGSLTFYCAIDNGLPLNLARGVGFIKTLSGQVEQIKKKFSRIELTLGCDCILRRLELQKTGVQADVEALLGQINFVGFSTFGEQYDSIHVNQTMTGVVIGGA